MNRIVLGTFAAGILLSAVLAVAQQAKPSYPGIAPIDQYLMADRESEIALARSAAPESISRDATVLVMGRRGYETADEGKNGFVCVVERAWMAPASSAEFWNPRIRGPVCFNPAAARTVLPVTRKRTEMALAGASKDKLMKGIQAAFERKELLPVEPGAIGYMLSKNAYLTDAGDHNLAHIMFYASRLNAAAWGADLPGSPIIFGGSDPITVFFVPVGRWSDGTAAPLD